MKFFEIFDAIRKGNFGLTDEAVYLSIPRDGVFLPLFGGSEEHAETERWISENGRTKYDEPITKFEGDGIILSLDGSAGSMTYTHDRPFALNHHAGFLTVRKESKSIVDPEFFSLFYETQLRETSVSEGSKTLTHSILEKMELDLPDFETQKMIMKQISPLLAKHKTLDRILKNILFLKTCTLSFEYSSYQAKNIPVTEILTPHNGNSGLTEEEIYLHILEDGDRYEIISSSTDENTRMGVIPKTTIRGKPLKLFTDQEGILVVRNGKAGMTYFIKRSKFAMTDHAYFLTLNQNCPYSIDLKWFLAQYKNVFSDYVSSADNATWNKTEFFKNVKVDIPSLSEQVSILSLYDRLDILEKSIKGAISKIDVLFSRQVVSG